MKRLLMIITLLLLVITAYSQSFYHKKMKKVDKRASSYECEAVKPKVTFVQSLNQTMQYQKKRKEYKYLNKRKRSRALRG
jgi:uncharacterized protein YxeA